MSSVEFTITVPTVTPLGSRLDRHYLMPVPLDELPDSGPVQLNHRLPGPGGITFAVSAIVDVDELREGGHTVTAEPVELPMWTIG